MASILQQLSVKQNYNVHSRTSIENKGNFLAQDHPNPQVYKTLHQSLVNNLVEANIEMETDVIILKGSLEFPKCNEAAKYDE